MKLAIHQPHYLPWLGYLDKMAKCDVFMLMDTVQLNDASNMFRNKFATKTGGEKYLTVCFQKKGYMEKPFNEVLLNQQVPWQRDHKNFLTDTYRKSPYFEEVWEKVAPLFETPFETVCEADYASILIERELYDIQTPLIWQHDYPVEEDVHKNDLVKALCLKAGASEYLSGNGARAYMDTESFAKDGVLVTFQSFSYPTYPQWNQTDFIPNLSGLDLMFSCGIEKAREIFWNKVKENR